MATQLIQRNLETFAAARAVLDMMPGVIGLRCCQSSGDHIGCQLE
jgi:hypothetical protein